MQYPYGSNSVPWNHGITVWRNNNYTPVFDTSYQYKLSAVLTQRQPDGHRLGTSPIQQWNQSAGLGTSVFDMAPSGSSWTISPMNNVGQVPRRGRRRPTAPASWSTPATAPPRRTGTSPPSPQNGSLQRRHRRHRPLHERPRRQHLRRARHGGLRLHQRLDQPAVQHPGDRLRRRHQRLDVDDHDGHQPLCLVLHQPHRDSRRASPRAPSPPPRPATRPRPASAARSRAT